MVCKSLNIYFSLKDFEQAIKNYNCVYFLIIIPSKIKSKANIPSQFYKFQSIFLNQKYKEIAFFESQKLCY